MLCLFSLGVLSVIAKLVLCNLGQSVSLLNMHVGMSVYLTGITCYAEQELQPVKHVEQLEHDHYGIVKQCRMYVLFSNVQWLGSQLPQG